jgi:hypothetical protein
MYRDLTKTEKRGICNSNPPWRLLRLLLLLEQPMQQQQQQQLQQ